MPLYRWRERDTSAAAAAAATGALLSRLGGGDGAIAIQQPTIAVRDS